MLQPDAVYVLKAQEPVHSLAFFNQQLFVGKKSGNIALFCLSSLRSNYELKAGTNPITYISTTPESLISQDKNGVLKIWDLQKGGYVMRQETDIKYLGFARAHHIIDKKILVVPHSSSNLSVIDLTTGKEIACLKPPKEDIKHITSITVVNWDNGDTYLLAGYESGHLILWDLKQSKAVDRIKFDFAVTTHDYDLSSNRGLASGPGNVKVVVFGIDKATFELYKHDEDIEYLPNEGEKLYGINCIKIRPDKVCGLVGTCDGIVYVHSWKSLRKFCVLRDHRGEISDIAFSNGSIDNFKSPIMAVGGVDGNISLWDIYYK